MDNQQELLEKWDKKYLWHPFTQMKDYLEEKPLIIEAGEGSYLIDLEGNRYLDGISSIWLNVHGHRHPKINQAIEEQLNKIAHSTLLGMANVPAIKLAKRLIEIVPLGLSKVFYSDNGSTAVEIGIKMAFQYWQQKDQGQYKAKQKFISLQEAYHGDTIGSVSVGGIDLYHQVYRPLLFHGFQLASPYCYRCPQGLARENCQLACLADLEEILSNHHQEIAALVVEPLVQGAAGIITTPPGYLKRIRELCWKYDILLIADEVATGFGRTGSMFACSQERVSPDIMCVAKGITGGYLPLAATITTQEIYQTFLGEYSEKRTFFHGHSYTGNQLACAAGLASLDVFQEENTLEQIQTKVKFLQEKLTKFYELEHVGDIRQAGMMIGIELVKDKTTKETYPWEQKMGAEVSLLARKKGLLTRPLGNVVVLMPILSMSLAELERMLEITYSSIAEVTGRSREGC